MKDKTLRLSRGGWWPCEERVLVSMLEDNHPVHFIAEVLQRDRMGVHAKIKIMERQKLKKQAIAA